MSDFSNIVQPYNKYNIPKHNQYIKLKVTHSKNRPSSLTMHELKEFVDHSFEELPVSSEKAWILANNVHNVGGYDGLIVLPSLLLTQT